MSMHAAVVRSFDHPPRYETYDTPEPDRADEALVDVLAVGLHPRVRTGASGRHYTSTGTLPMIPGIDGVGRLPDGRRVYFVVPRRHLGLDGRAGRRRPAPNRPLARGRRRGQGGGGHEPGHVRLGGAAPPGSPPAGPVGPGPRRHRQRRRDGRAGGQTPGCRPGRRCRPQPGTARRAPRSRGRRGRRSGRRSRGHGRTPGRTRPPRWTS